MFYKAVIKDGETGTKLGFFVSSASPTEAKAEVLCLLANILTQDLDDDERENAKMMVDGDKITVTTPDGDKHAGDIVSIKEIKFEGERMELDLSV